MLMLLVQVPHFEHQLQGYKRSEQTRVLSVPFTSAFLASDYSSINKINEWISHEELPFFFM